MTAQEVSPFVPKVSPADVLAIIPGLNETDVRRMQTLAEVSRFCIGETEGLVGEALYGALSESGIQYSSPAGERTYPPDYASRIVRANARTAARGAARNGLIYRISSNPMITEVAHPIPEILAELKNDTEYRGHLTTWQILGGKESFNRAQATLIDRLARTIGQRATLNV